MRTRLAQEQGFSIAIAIVLMTMMLSVGLVSFAYVDTEQDQSRVERVDESAFNLGEGVLNQQAFVLSRFWPSQSSGRVYPTSCTQAAAPADFCPQPDAVATSFASVDYETGAPAWTTTVRDDVIGVDFYDAAVIPSQPTFDDNDNGEVWVHAQATFTVGPDAGRTRTMVARVKIEEIALSYQFPDRTIIAGKFATGNNGNKKIVETGSEAGPRAVTVRCANTSDPACMKYRSPVQISPESVAGGEYVGEPAVAESTVNALREKALANGTFYATGCPSSLSGEVVYVVGGGLCKYTGNSTYNSSSSPGIVVFESGKLELSGNTNFYGVLYMLNTQNLTDIDVAKVQGNAEVYGRVFVDGDGGVLVGQSKTNLIYDDFTGVANAPRIYGTAGIVQNSWSELPGVN